MPTIKPITKHDFADKYWNRSQNYQFASKDIVAPLVVHELPKVAMMLPISFILNKKEGAIPVAVMGLEPGNNLLIDSHGKWATDYIPAIYRGYPFSLGSTSEGKQLLCIDADSGLITDEFGETFFTASGEPSKSISEVMNFLDKIDQNRQLTRLVCRKLLQYDLIQPWTIKIKVPDGEKSIIGLNRIDENKLYQLDTDSFDDIRQSGALSLIYGQLFSMQHLPKIVKLVVKQQAVRANEVPDIEQLFGEKDDLFSFN